MQAQRSSADLPEFMGLAWRLQWDKQIRLGARVPGSGPAEEGPAEGVRRRASGAERSVGGAKTRENNPLLPKKMKNEEKKQKRKKTTKNTHKPQPARK